MRLFYLDNFRGFSNSFIPIKDVNFFLGENSTGKTSILSIIYLLSLPHFWFNQSFNTDQLQFGTFKDIVSVTSSDRTYFKVGFFECKDNPTLDDVRNAYAILMTFVEEDGAPIISNFSYFKENTEVNVICSTRSFMYKISSVSFSQNDPCKAILSIFKKWTTEAPSGEGFIESSLKDIPFHRRQALGLIPFLIEKPPRSRTHKEKEASQSESFSFTLSLPEFAHSFAWIAPIRSKPKRTYDQLIHDFTPEGDHAPYIIRQILTEKKKSSSFTNFIKQFGKDSNLFDALRVEQYGRLPESPFSIKVILNKNPLNISSVGYGVSQSLPVIVELHTRIKASWYAVQQPEIHLHPRAQAAFGDVIYHCALKENKRFLIETHSDYLVDRFRLRYRKSKSTALTSQVLYFERTETGNRIYDIEIDSNGNYPEDQPKSFREFFLKEEMALLDLV